MGDATEAHLPVMVSRITELLTPALSEPGAVLVDATLGMGGHTAALLEAHPQLRVIGIDRDVAALERVRQRLPAAGSRLELVHSAYDHLDAILDARGLPRVQAVLLDLGVSSPQLDEPDRGFAYSHDAALDMRMDRGQRLTAAEIVNTYSAQQLTRVLRDNAEERFAGRIAEAIVRRRARAPIDTTTQLAEIVREAIPSAARRSGGHPAKRSFQALRIEVNDELGLLRHTLPRAVARLALHGRLAVLSYHSLEDRITKRELARHTTDTTPPGLPVSLPQARPRLRSLTRGAETPSPAESETNPRSASARLRAAERVREPEGDS